MKKILLVVFVFSACNMNERHRKLQPLVDKIKQNYIAELGDVKKIDTIYLLLDTITPQSKIELQAMQYFVAKSSLKYTGELPKVDTAFPINYDTAIIAHDLKYMYDSLMAVAKKTDGITFLYYEAHPLVIYTKNNKEVAMAESKLYFDSNFNLIPVNSFIQPISQHQYFVKPESRKYIQLTREMYDGMEKDGVLKYY